MRIKNDHLYKKLKIVSGVFVFITSPSLCLSLFPKILLNTHTCRYEAGAERGKNVFGLLSAESHGGESGDSHAETAVSAWVEQCGLESCLSGFVFRGSFPELLCGPQFPIHGMGKKFRPCHRKCMEQKSLQLNS